MITIKKVADEHDVRIMCDIESGISKQSELLNWPVHIGGLIFDRYMFGSGASDIFTYGKLLSIGDSVIGYALIYFDEELFTIRLIPEHENLYNEVFKEIEKLFFGFAEYSVIANTCDEELHKTLVERGYLQKNEKRFQAGLHLKTVKPENILWENETISILTENDIAERAEYAVIPTGEKINEKMYVEYFNSDSYKNSLDYVIRDSSTKELVGFVTWWIDEGSSTALLEPVGCLEKFRRQGIMQKALKYGFGELKDKGIQYAYVCTSIDNIPAQKLYESVGFSKIGSAYCFTKTILE
jgi:ribosomal protein S18 acetylase RimI-like enzyme